jgi:hypothetical protein
MENPNSLPESLTSFLIHWLVPLFLLYNIGWVGLPRREANRSNPVLSEQELSDLRKSIRTAWFVGLRVALAGLSAVSEFYQPSLEVQTKSLGGAAVAGVVGLVSGIVRGVLPRSASFCHKQAITRRHILSAFVIAAVAVSIPCAVLYCNSGLLLKSLIASGYASMLIGYAAYHVFEVGR